MPALNSLRKLSALVLIAMVMVFTPALAKPPGVTEKYSQTYINANLVVGKTTIKEVEERFGKPHEVSSYSEGAESITWAYRRDKEKTFRGLVSKAQSKIFSAGRLIGGRALDAAHQTGGAAEEIERKADDTNELLGANGDSGKIGSISIDFRNGVIARRSWH